MHTVSPSQPAGSQAPSKAWRHCEEPAVKGCALVEPAPRGPPADRDCSTVTAPRRKESRAGDGALGGRQSRAIGPPPLSLRRKLGRVICPPWRVSNPHFGSGPDTSRWVPSSPHLFRFSPWDLVPGPTGPSRLLPLTQLRRGSGSRAPGCGPWHLPRGVSSRPTRLRRPRRAPCSPTVTDAARVPSRFRRRRTYPPASSLRPASRLTPQSLPAPPGRTIFSPHVAPP